MDRLSPGEEAGRYLALLIGILVLFIVINLGVRASGWRRPLSKYALHVFSISYGFVYAVMAGVLIYFGIENLNDYFRQFVEDRGIINLLSVSIVAMFCLLYAAFFHDTVSKIAGERLRISAFANVAGYVAARVLLIGGLVLGSLLVVSKTKKHKEQSELLT